MRFQLLILTIASLKKFITQEQCPFTPPHHSQCRNLWRGCIQPHNATELAYMYAPQDLHNFLSVSASRHSQRRSLWRGCMS
jgi:hypothetical protein